jgi:hypothetical protein
MTLCHAANKVPPFADPPRRRRHEVAQGGSEFDCDFAIAMIETRVFTGLFEAAAATPNRGSS